MSKKAGRPPKIGPKSDRHLTIRLTAVEKAELKNLAKTTGGTVTAVIKKAIHAESAKVAGAADV